MKITGIRVKIIDKDDSKLKCVASVVFDDEFVVHDIKVIENNEEKLFVVMPSRKIPAGEYKDIAHPLNNEFREYLKVEVLEAYEKALEERKEEGGSE